MRREMKDVKDAGEMARKAKQAMKKSLSDLDRAINPVTTSLYEDDDYVLPRPLKAGDKVFLIDLNKEGDVLSAPDKRGQVEVQAGAIRMRVKLDRVRLIEKKQEQKKTAPVMTRNRGTESRLTAAAENRCDLRGMTVDEAIFTLDSFIDSMLMSGLNEFTIIHGKGTGTLRAAVQKHLKDNKFIKSYRLGLYGEGENGVTIATLK